MNEQRVNIAQFRDHTFWILALVVPCGLLMFQPWWQFLIYTLIAVILNWKLHFLYQNSYGTGRRGILITALFILGNIALFYVCNLSVLHTWSGYGASGKWWFLFEALAFGGIAPTLIHRSRFEPEFPLLT